MLTSLENVPSLGQPPTLFSFFFCLFLSLCLRKAPDRSAEPVSQACHLGTLELLAPGRGP